MKTVFVTGATGLLGSSLVPLLMQRGYSVKIYQRSGPNDYQLDFSNPKVVNKLFDEIRPEIIINLIGLTDVDRCEAEPNQAFLTNVRTVENIANWIKREEPTTHLVHISTDQVYDGLGLHTEDQVFLTNYYAFSKYAGELAAATIPSSIIRTNFFGRSRCTKRTSLTDWLYQTLSTDENIQVFYDVLFSPLSIVTLSEMIELIVQKKPIGLFNLGTHQGMSKADFAFEFARELNLPTGKMMRTTTDQVSFLKTYRPKDMRMDSSKFEKITGIKMPELKDEIMRVTKEYNEIT